MGLAVLVGGEFDDHAREAVANPHEAVLGRISVLPPSERAHLSDRAVWRDLALEVEGHRRLGRDGLAAEALGVLLAGVSQTSA